MTGGLAFEGINNAGHLGKQFLVILNDNEMSISPNVGALSSYFTRLISNPLYNRVRNEFWDLTGRLPIAKSQTRTLIKKVEESLKGLIVPGILFDELGFRYFGPIDGHDLNMVISTLENIKDIQIFYGNFEEFYSKYNVSNLIFKEHPLNKHYSGLEDQRDWLFKIEGEYLSFFKYWNKIRKKII